MNISDMVVIGEFMAGETNNNQQVGCTTLVGRMHNFSGSDAQLLQVGCTTLVGRMHNFCRSDAVTFIKMTKFQPYMWGIRVG